MTSGDMDIRVEATDFPNYLDEALGILKKRASAEGLIVDHDGTAAVQSLLGNAIQQARQQEGAQFASPEHQREFAQTATILAEKATDAARIEQSQFVAQRHIERAIDFLLELKIWPFSRSTRQPVHA